MLKRVSCGIVLDLFLINQVLVDASVAIKNSDSPFLIFEMTVLKLLEMENSIDLQELILKIESENNSFKNSQKKRSGNLKEPQRDIIVNEISNAVLPTANSKF